MPPDLLLKGMKEDLSRTWKERHAKGVPVKLYMTDVDEDKRMAWYDLDTETDDNMHMIDGDDNICVYALTGKDTDERIIATFCNFRYKQSWLDKKGGDNAV
jgi:hypothetical protein